MSAYYSWDKRLHFIKYKPAAACLMLVLVRQRRLLYFIGDEQMIKKISELTAEDKAEFLKKQNRLLFGSKVFHGKLWKQR